VTRPRAADDFATIRARLKELRPESPQAVTAEPDARTDRPQRGRTTPTDVSGSGGKARRRHGCQRSFSPIPPRG